MSNAVIVSNIVIVRYRTTASNASGAERSEAGNAMHAMGEITWAL